jgi:hypothetical protein
MKNAKIVIMAVFGALALWVTSSRGQTLNLKTGAVLEGDLTNQALINSGTEANDGMVSSWVVNDSSVDSQGYIFIYQLELSSQAPDQVLGVNFNNFNSADIVSMGVGLYSNVVASDSFSLPAALNATASLYPNFTFEAVSSEGAATFGLFSPDVGLDPGTVSWFIVIETDDKSFNTGYALTQDDFQAHGDILAPIGATFPVPEPASAVLLLAGFACFYGILRCRRSIE